MHQSPLKVHVRLDTHPAHPSAVTASLTGTHHRTAQAMLAARGFEQFDEHTMALARIDHEKPYGADQATQALDAEGITTEITPGLSRMPIPDRIHRVRTPRGRQAINRSGRGRSVQMHGSFRTGAARLSPLSLSAVLVRSQRKCQCRVLA
ncbi:hypothetical protein GCM10010365_71440 [Streptomyces poonensis]|uniref:Uncharacterized protein n=1 Tax=Streptomyces poonensis TaxID=68255 RepID=A0A918QC57_9ACTN|nr:hypothetical protein [Streptomyces poonensis]GGZ40406.1 hypothetical protein GCM10010365_71440 [Streptomyces poonensis]GLJ93021.1 hypothetical protein GCM10017589_56330 [Streptomyces poonensis]